MKTWLYLASAAILGIVTIVLFLLRARKKRLRDKKIKRRLLKSNPNQRVITCPSCSQQIRFIIPISGNKAQCRKCTAQFKLEVDARGNVYITEIKLPEPDKGIKTLDECFEILEIDPDAIPMDIKAAYRKKILEYHPDRVESLGTKIKHVAEEETRRLNAAYAMLQENERV
jgi:DnaJ-domain-containing protein 1